MLNKDHIYIKMIIFLYISFVQLIFIVCAEKNNKDKNFFVTVRPITEKVRQYDSFAEDKNPIINIQTAQDEYESAQFILYSKKETIQNIKISIEQLKGPEKITDQIKFYFYMAHYIKVNSPSDNRGKIGFWPDPLIPINKSFTLKPNKNQSIWLKIKTTKKALPGIYIGKILVHSMKKQLAKIDLNIKVWNVTLDQKDKMYFAVGVDYESIYNQEKGSIKSKDKKFLQDKFKHLILPEYYYFFRESHIAPLMIYDALPEVSERNGKIKVDFIEYEKNLKEAYQDNFTGPILVPFAKNWPVDTKEFPLFSVEYNKWVIQYLKEVVKYFDKRSLISQNIIYFDELDEPTKKEQYKLIKKFSKLFHQADPRLRLLVTLHAKCMDCDDIELKDIDAPNILWCPNIAFLAGKALSLRKRFGGIIHPAMSMVKSSWQDQLASRIKNSKRKIWLYVNPWTWILGGTEYSFPNLYIDHSGIMHRLLPWLSHLYGINTIAHWNLTYWREISSPWDKVPRGEMNQQPNGDGSLIYPGYKMDKYTGQLAHLGPVTSIRLELLREGMEDIAFIKQLKRKGNILLAKKYLNGIVKSFYDFTDNPDDFNIYREKIFKAILK